MKSKRIITVLLVLVLITFAISYFLSAKDNSVPSARIFAATEKNPVDLIENPGQETFTDQIIRLFNNSNNGSKPPSGWKTTKNTKVYTRPNIPKSENISTHTIQLESFNPGGMSTQIPLLSNHFYKVTASVYVIDGLITLTAKDANGNIINKITNLKTNNWEDISISIASSKQSNSSQSLKGLIRRVYAQTPEPDNPHYTIEISGATKQNNFFISNVFIGLSGGSGNSCDPGDTQTCEFFEQCTINTLPPSCQFNPDWRNTLENKKKREILTHLANNYGIGIYDIPLPPLETSSMNFPLLSIKISPRSTQPFLNDELMKQIITATYPELSQIEKDNIYDGFQDAIIYDQKGIIIDYFGFVLDLASLPAGGGLPALKTLGGKFINVIRHPKAIGPFIVKVGSSSKDLVAKLKTIRSPAKIAPVFEMKDGHPIISAGNYGDESSDTYKLLRLETYSTKTSSGVGYSTNILNLTQRVADLANDAKKSLRSIGAIVDEKVPIEVARSVEDFKALHGGETDVWGFWDSGIRKIIINPQYLRESKLKNLISHEMLHQVMNDAGLPKKISRFFNSTFDERLNEGLTEYLAAKATDGNLVHSIYRDRVKAIRSVFYRYVYDYLDFKGYERTPENIIWVKDWLDQHIYSYAFSNSTELEKIYDTLYGKKGSFGEILFRYFEGISYKDNDHTIADSSFLQNIIHKISFIVTNSLNFKVQAAVVPTDCCYDWPDDGELKIPFVNALETSIEKGIDEWGSDNFVTLLQLEWLRNRLNQTGQLTSTDFQTLENLGFEVKYEQGIPQTYIDMESLPIDDYTGDLKPNPIPSDQISIPTPSPNTYPSPTYSTQPSSRPTQTITTSPAQNYQCSTGWFCYDECASSEVVDLFTKTHGETNAKKRWYEEKEVNSHIPIGCCTSNTCPIPTNNF